MILRGTTLQSSFLFACSCTLTAAALGQDAGRDSTEVYELEDFAVTSHVVEQIDAYSLGEVDFIDEAELARIAQSTLGETLSWLPGVSSSYFGQGASRPVIRGFEGYRVRMLQDSIGTLDVSDSSPDHGVALEPLLIREIDIHRGPSALLFGNSAIGGAVNSKSRLIAEEYPEQAISGSIEGRYDTVSDGKSAAGYIEVPVKRFVINLMGSWRDADDYDIPGRARTSEYQEANLGVLVKDPDSGLSVPVPNPKGTLPNTYLESEMKAVGITWIPENAAIQLGAGYTRFDSEYGVPYQYAGGENDLFGLSSLDMEQDRFDFDARFETEHTWFSTVHAHAGYAEYSHVEDFSGLGKDSDKNFEDTMFDLDSFEARVDFYQRSTDWLEGVVGFHMQRQDLGASFLAAPPLPGSRFANAYETENFGFFALETISLGSVKIQTGLRLESQTIDDVSFEEFGFVTSRSDQSFSFANNLTWELKDVAGLDSLVFTPSVSYIERLPTATERYAFWPNPAIQRFLIGGDLDGEPLDNEESLGYELGIEARKGIVATRLNFYYYEYENFIFLQDQIGIGNPAAYVGKEAEFYGFEAEVSVTQDLGADTTLVLKGMTDRVRGENKTDNMPLPRIPPLRIGTRAELQRSQWMAGLDIRYAFEQDRVQPGGGEVQPELETGAYTEVNFDANYTFAFGEATIDLFCKISNLLDESRRVHTSFIKDVAPLPGRNFTFGLRSSF